MQFRGDDRAQSVQVGAILLFGILIVTLATFQATVVPDQNAGVEFDHSQAVQSDMQDLRNGILRAVDGDASPTRVTLGTRYPNRLRFINPPPPTGDLRTVGADDPAMNVTIGNESGSVRVVSEHENAKAYWANAGDAGVYNTSEIVYSPDYAEYDGAPSTVYGDSVLFNTFDTGANRTLSGQRVVQGNTINLLALRGDLDATAVGSETVDVTALSEQARTVTVRSNESDPLYVNVTSRLSAAVWNEDLLGGNAEASDAGTVPSNDVAYHRISIELAPGTYKLRGSAVGVGALTDDERVTDPAYMIVTDGYQPTTNGTNGTLTVEVRDQFNNPVTNATVNASADGEYLRLLDEDDGAVDETAVETDAEGQATVEYHSDSTTAGDAWLNVSLGNATEPYEREEFEGLTVPAFDGGNDGTVNPGGIGDVVLTNSEYRNGNESQAILDFNNTGTANITLVSARAEFFYKSNLGGNPGPETLTFVEGDVRTARGPTLAQVNFSGDYADLQPAQIFESGEVRSITVELADNEFSFQSSLFSITLIYETEDGVRRSRYIVAPSRG